MAPIIFDFEDKELVIGSSANEWGPYSFEMSPGIPSGTTITAASVKSYLWESDAETTSLLIDGAASPSGTTFTQKFKYPTGATQSKHYLAITITLNTGAINTFYFKYVYVN